MKRLLYASQKSKRDLVAVISRSTYKQTQTCFTASSAAFRSYFETSRIDAGITESSMMVRCFVCFDSNTL